MGFNTDVQQKTYINRSFINAVVGPSFYQFHQAALERLFLLENEMQTGFPFSVSSKTKPISVTDVASTSTALPGSGNTLRVINEGPDNAFISVGSGTQTATLPNATPTATSTPILGGEDVTFSIPNDTTYNISAICRSGKTATIDVQVGEGS